MKLFGDNESRERAGGGSGEDEFAGQRAEMIEKQLRRRGITDFRVLGAMNAVHREEFVPREFRVRSYDDAPLPIGEGPVSYTHLTLPTICSV